MSKFDHKSATANQISSMNSLRAIFKAAEDSIFIFVPDSTERDNAMKALEESAMWANKGIVHND